MLDWKGWALPVQLWDPWPRLNLGSQALVKNHPWRLPATDQPPGGSFLPARSRRPVRCVGRPGLEGDSV